MSLSLENKTSQNESGRFEYTPLPTLIGLILAQSKETLPATHF
jgi:hypothetical protein